MEGTPQIFHFDDHKDSTFLLGTYRAEKNQLDWIVGKNPQRYEMLYNIRYNENIFESRKGGVLSGVKPDYIIIYNHENLSDGCHMFPCISFTKKSEEEMSLMEYPSPQGNYIVYLLGEEIIVDSINLETLIGTIKGMRSVENAPILVKGDLITQHVDSSKKPTSPLKTEKKNVVRFIDLFAGIGGIRLPFDELGYKCVFSSEWDSKAAKTYIANFNEKPYGDITLIPEKDIPKHDLLLAGFPCQAFSIIGKMKGFEDTRGTMFFEIARILKYHQPKAFLLENVKQLTTHDKGRTFEVIQNDLTELGYFFKWKVLNALDFGLPQKRERVIIVGFKEKENCEKFNFDFEKIPYDLSSILEKDEDVDKSLFASEKIISKRRAFTKNKNVFYPSIWHENKAGNISVLDHSCALRTGASYNYLLVNGVRRPSSRELLRLQGFPDSYKIVLPNQDVRKQTGNSVAVPMIRAVANKINEIINNN